MVKSHPKVSIVLSDRGWILETMGKALQTRLPGIALNDAADPSADINYYITFACRKAPVDTLEMAFFTHMEQAPELQRLFIDTARAVDLPVCQSARYRDVLVENGIDKAIVIPPGVDRDLFDVRLRVGVVGRTYHTGRKGEALVDQVMDMDGIDWHFTGTGWPRPGRALGDADMPDFYRSLDYVLVPALYEGGPMCVPEALAVGTPVIASDVGWIPDFPHIAFKTGDAADLRRVLSGLVAQKRALRASTQDRTWDAFAAAHERAFADVMKAAGKTGVLSWLTRKDARAAPPATAVRLLLHGEEHRALGGPTVRVPRTAEALQDIGVPAQAGPYLSTAQIPENTVHLFNVWPPQSALRTMQQIKAAGKKIVFSPIYLDLGARAFWQGQLPQLSFADLDAYAETYRKARTHLASRGRLAEPIPGYHAMIRTMLELADHVIFLSQAERDALAEIGAPVEDTRASLVRNPVDAALWQDSDPALFRDAYLRGLPGPQDYVVCIGRIEERKNQLLLARAMRDLPARLVLIGHEGSPAYTARVREEAGPDFLMIDRLGPASDMLRSAVAGARVFALPSWAEGASLATLEAAATGAQMVLGDRSSEAEYFGDLAHYCDVGDPRSIQAALRAALDIPPREATRRAETLKARVAEQFTWARHATETARAYAAAEKTPARPLPRGTAVARPGIVMDVTMLARHRQGQPDDATRVEALLARGLRDRDTQARFICWNDSLNRFIDIPPDAVTPTGAWRHNSRFDSLWDTPDITLSDTATLVVAGDTWASSRAYVTALEDLKARSRCGLITLVHDLTPLTHPFWRDAPEGQSPRDSFYHLAELTDHVLTPSETVTEVVAEHLARHEAVPCAVSQLDTGGAYLPAPDPEDAPGDAAPSALRARLDGLRFVLAVGDMRPQANYEMLHRVWARFHETGDHADLHLIIVGRVMPESAALAAQFRHDTRVNGRVHVLGDVTDTDLAWLYDACLMTVLPAHVESWALPVRQSLALGKPCLASTAAASPGMAAMGAERIDPEDFTTWAHRIGFLAASGAARALPRQERAPTPPADWTRAAGDLAEVAGAPRVARLARPVHAAEPIRLGSGAAALSVLCDAGWHPRQNRRRWTRAPRARLTVNLGRVQGAPDDPLTLILRLKGQFGATPHKDLRIEAGDREVLCTRLFKASGLSDLVFRVPRAALDAEGRLTLTFDAPLSPAGRKTHGSLRGIGVESIRALGQAHCNPLHAVAMPAHWSRGQSPLHIDLCDPAHRAIVAPHQAFSPAWGLGGGEGRCDVFVPVLPGAPAQTLSLTVRPVARATHPVTAEIFWNGARLTRATWQNDDTVSIDLALSAQQMAGPAPHRLTVLTGARHLPVDLGIGVGDTVSGVGVFDIQLTPRKETE